MPYNITKNSIKYDVCLSVRPSVPLM